MGGGGGGFAVRVRVRVRARVRQGRPTACGLCFMTGGGGRAAGRRAAGGPSSAPVPQPWPLAPGSRLPELLLAPAGSWLLALAPGFLLSGVMAICAGSDRQH
jgi:hypothetical protein